MKSMRAIMLLFLTISGLHSHGQHEQAYVVDTITIASRHKAFIEKKGAQIVIYFKGDQLEKVRSSSIEQLINNYDVYFTSISYCSFFRPTSPFEKAPTNCKEELEMLRKGKIEISKVSNVDKFILCLVNINYFNLKQESVDFKSWHTRLDQGAYIKVVYPFCD